MEKVDLVYSSPSSGEPQSACPSPHYALPASLDHSWTDVGNLDEDFLSSNPEPQVAIFPRALSPLTVQLNTEELGEIDKIKNNVLMKETLKPRIPK